MKLAPHPRLERNPCGKHGTLFNLAKTLSSLGNSLEMLPSASGGGGNYSRAVTTTSGRSTQSGQRENQPRGDISFLSLLKNAEHLDFFPTTSTFFLPVFQSLPGRQQPTGGRYQLPRQLLTSGLNQLLGSHRRTPTGVTGDYRRMSRVTPSVVTGEYRDWW